MTKGIMHFWQYLPTHITPYIIRFGPFQIRYYGLMYIVAFAVIYLLVMKRIRNEEYTISKDAVQNFFVWIIIGLMVGARIGYVLIYNLDYYIKHPVEIMLPLSLSGGVHFTGLAGMSYHGGLVGVIIAAVVYCRRHSISFLYMSDLFIPAIPLGYTFGRLGNFINGELFGRATTKPWGMYFPSDPSGQLRHPSQLYEAFFEGLFLFIILWSLRRKISLKGHFLAIYLMGYGCVRFFIEFVREPDTQIGFVASHMTMGQLLCIIMILTGSTILILRKSHNR